MNEENNKGLADQNPSAVASYSIIQMANDKKMEMKIEEIITIMIIRPSNPIVGPSFRSSSYQAA